jgi:FlaA1/EpsC-like NDP-sugar epimerase
MTDDIQGAFRRNYKQFVMLGVDAILLSLALLLALWVRLGMIWLPPDPIDQLTLYGTLLASLFFFVRLGLYRSIIRYMGQQAIFAVLQAVTISATILAIAAFLTGGFMPRSVPIIYWCFAYVFIGGSRLLIRAYYQKGVQIHKQRVAIYGAGTSGLQVFRALLHGIEYKPVFFVDDNMAKQGMIIDGLHVYPSASLQEQLEKYRATKVLIAMPSVSMHRRREVMRELESKGIEAHIVPGVEDLLDSTPDSNNVSRVYESVLGRDPVQPDDDLMQQCIAGKVVMVTGAGGSIGGELCRQILLQRPVRLVLVDSSEYALYQINRDLMEEEYFEDLDVEVVPLLGNTGNKSLMSRIITTYGVNTIYHAAAYKHLPIVETNMVEGVHNNIFGTIGVAEAAVANEVETFILVSTDKAVRPTSVMGATKRCAEMICQSFNFHFPTRFCMVRFGNVLGSSGSVIPLFFEQINAGGPVTVTHPDVTRYFMTLHEAAQLVIQAGSMGKGGDIFVLDMGEPIRIMDIAERMIQLMGHEKRDAENPDGDIEILISGLRSGEKLYEELLLGENVTGTNHPMILRAEEPGAEFVNLQSYLGKLSEACKDADCQKIRNLLSEFIPEYKAAKMVTDFLWRSSPESNLEVDGKSLPDNVEPLLRKPK